MAKTQAKVETPCIAYNAMSAKWPKLDALMDSSAAMRDLGEDVLPKAKAEESDCYDVRLAMAYLYGSYKKTVKKVAGKPFSKNVTIQGDLAGPLSMIKCDVDNKQTAIEEFGRDLVEEGVHRGLTHILVDYPVTVDESGKTPTLAEEREEGLKPYFTHISPKDLISWTFGEDGKLDEIRFKESSVEKDGTWGEKKVDRIRVITRTTFEVYRKTDKEYIFENGGDHSFGKVPLITIYMNKTGEMTGESCLTMLAEAEEDYFQSKADQKYGLHYGRFPFLAATGLTSDEAKEPIVVSARTFLRSTNEKAKYSWVTHDGQIFDIGFKDLDRIIARMEALGLEPMVQRSGNVTATSKAIDQSNYDSDMQSWIRLVENAIEQAYRLAAEIIGTELPEDFKVNIFNEFSISVKSNEYTEYLLKSCVGGLISKETYWEALRRFGILPENHNAETEKERLEEQGPELGTLGLEGDDDE